MTVQQEIDEWLKARPPSWFTVRRRQTLRRQWYCLVKALGPVGPGAAGVIIQLAREAWGCAPGGIINSDTRWLSIHRKGSGFVAEITPSCEVVAQGLTEWETTISALRAAPVNDFDQVLQGDET